MRITINFYIYILYIIKNTIFKSFLAVDKSNEKNDCTNELNNIFLTVFGESKNNMIKKMSSNNLFKNLITLL